MDLDNPHFQEFLEKYVQLGVSVDIIKTLYKPPQPPTPPAPMIEKEVKVKRTIRKPKRLLLDVRSSKRRKSATKVGPINHDDIQINKQSGPDCFRDKVLSVVNIDTYHQHTAKDEYLTRILTMSQWNERSHIDRFIYQSSAFFVRSWLSNARIFEYNRDQNSYHEVKRLPQRYFSLASDLITSLHYCENKFYLAHLNDVDMEDKDAKPSRIDIRDIRGQQVGKSYHYDRIVKSIRSDDEFIYVIALRNLIYIHRKRIFNFAPYRIDLQAITKKPIRSVAAKKFNNGKPNLQLVICTSDEVFIIRYNPSEQKLVQVYSFDDSLVTVSAEHQDGRIILLRNSDLTHTNSSKIEIGSVLDILDKKIRGGYFVREFSLRFNYHVLQIESGLNKNDLYIFARDVSRGEDGYEVGLFDLEALKPIWVASLADVDVRSKILPQEDHLVIVKDSQKYFPIRFRELNCKPKFCDICEVEMPLKDLALHNAHPGLFRDLKVFYNTNIYDGYTTFKPEFTSWDVPVKME